VHVEVVFVLGNCVGGKVENGKAWWRESSLDEASRKREKKQTTLVGFRYGALAGDNRTPQQT
jgi:hypothetical protein